MQQFALFYNHIFFWKYFLIFCQHVHNVPYKRKRVCEIIFQFRLSIRVYECTSTSSLITSYEYRQIDCDAAPFRLCIEATAVAVSDRRRSDKTTIKYLILTISMWIIFEFSFYNRISTNDHIMRNNKLPLKEQTIKKI